MKMKEKNIKKIILAYSGGLDTSVIIPWLKENYNNCEVIAVVADVGQGSELDKIEEKAIKSGASKVYIENIKEEFVEEYIVPAIKAGAKYENKYLLGTALARPLIAKKLVEVAKKEKTNIICHGCTGKGNDQVRFELTIKAYMPNVQIIAPWRIWDIKSREEEFEYAKKHNIPLKITKETNYSKDKNIWHLSHEGLDLENPSNEPKYDEILEMGVSPEKALDNPTYIEISFEKGKPIALNGKNKTVIEIIKKLNKIGGENGIGIIDIVENRLVGMKSRGVYETPGGTILYKAHELLESICLDKDTMHYKINLSNDFAKQIYDGKWESLLTKSMISFIEKTQENVTGSVRLKLYKGNIIPAGIISKYSLYSEKIATFGEDDSYNQKDAEGFINLFGLSTKMTAEMESKLKGEE